MTDPTPTPEVELTPSPIETGTGPVAGGRGAIGRIAAAVAGIALFAGGLGFAVTQLGGDDGSAEDTVASLFAAIGDEDILGVLAALDPGERDALTDPMREFFGELERLEILDDRFDISSVAGIDLEFDDLRYRSQPVTETLTRVYVTGGTVRYSLDSDALPIGDFVDDTMTRFGLDYRGVTESGSQSDTGNDSFLVARKGAEGWRVSIGFTAAEAARDSAGLLPPTPADALAPIGSASPTDAVRSMVDAAIELDAAGVVARLAPTEFGALQEYWGLFVDPSQIDAVSDELDDLDITVHDLVLRTDGGGDRAVVFVDGYDIEVGVLDSTVRMSWVDDCFEISGDDVDLLGMTATDGPICADDLNAITSGGLDEMMDELGVEMPTLAPMRTPEAGITTVEHQGGWYVAPVSTGMDVTVALLRAIDRSHLDAAVDIAEAFVNAFLSGDFQGEMFAPAMPFPENYGTDPFASPSSDQFGDQYGAGGLGWDIDRNLPDPERFWWIEELAYEMADGDPQRALCSISYLQAMAQPGQLIELADAYRYRTDPSDDVQTLLIEALTSCS